MGERGRETYKPPPPLPKVINFFLFQKMDNVLKRMHRKNPICFFINKLFILNFWEPDSERLTTSDTR